MHSKCVSSQLLVSVLLFQSLLILKIPNFSYVCTIYVVFCNWFIGFNDKLFCMFRIAPFRHDNCLLE